MNKDLTFNYSYSAKDNYEIQEIRKKYLPQEESKLDELKRLDNQVQNSGLIEAMCIGIGGTLCLGLGMCLSMKVIGSGIMFMILGILLGIIGMVAMIVAYPVYHSVFTKTKEKYAPRILELTSELCSEK